MLEKRTIQRKFLLRSYPETVLELDDEVALYPKEAATLTEPPRNSPVASAATSTALDACDAVEIVFETLLSSDPPAFGPRAAAKDSTDLYVR